MPNYKKPQASKRKVSPSEPPRRAKRATPPPPKETPNLARLQKILSQMGIASRRKAEEMILEGRVKVNGHVIQELGAKANPNKDRITVDGRPLKPADPPTYLLLHKPVGVMTTLSDPEGRPTVRDLLGHLPVRVFPVGRLDFHSSGLLLLTNDGELAQRLTHPSYGIEKVYHVKVRGASIPEVVLQQLREGVRLDDGKTAPARVRPMRSREGKTWLEMVLTEGRRREVRRMCEAVGLSVEKLRRVALGPLLLGKLAPGDYRPLTGREIVALQRATRLLR